MNTALLIMVPIALAIAVLFLRLFFWSYKNGDIDDEAQNYRILLDDEADVDTDVRPLAVTPNAPKAVLLVIFMQLPPPGAGSR